ncbi:hypothetical protein J4Q44_G00236260 [Coregonus suidteri]|uniref:Uncharacterized protein n=1 Tax=Coregonus suidteri TaxID=861788 RepID=A0AAN8LMW1_9TELE
MLSQPGLVGLPAGQRPTDRQPGSGARSPLVGTDSCGERDRGESSGSGLQSLAHSGRGEAPAKTKTAGHQVTLPGESKKRHRCQPTEDDLKH